MLCETCWCQHLKKRFRRCRASCVILYLLRCGNIPQMLACWRHAALTVMRAAGKVKSAATLCRLAATPWNAFLHLGANIENERL